jgi:hypothetical protein
MACSIQDLLTDPTARDWELISLREDMVPPTDRVARDSALCRRAGRDLRHYLSWLLNFGARLPEEPPGIPPDHRFGPFPPPPPNWLGSGIASGGPQLEPPTIPAETRIEACKLMSSYLDEVAKLLNQEAERIEKAGAVGPSC